MQLYKVVILAVMVSAVRFSMGGFVEPTEFRQHFINCLQNTSNLVLNLSLVVDLVPPCRLDVFRVERICIPRSNPGDDSIAIKDRASHELEFEQQHIPSHSPDNSTETDTNFRCFETITEAVLEFASRCQTSVRYVASLSPCWLDHKIRLCVKSTL